MMKAQIVGRSIGIIARLLSAARTRGGRDAGGARPGMSLRGPCFAVMRRLCHQAQECKSRRPANTAK